MSLIRFLLGAFLAAHLTGTARAGETGKIKEVENGLMPYGPVKGFPGWNIHERMRHYNAPGASIAVIRDFKIDWAKGYGLADVSQKRPVTTNTMFSAGSISKLVLAGAVFKLAEEKSLALDENVNKYLRRWQVAENEWTRQTPVTLRRLLSHTAGASQGSYFGFAPRPAPYPNIVEILSGAPSAESRPVVINSDPREGFRYSGGGSMIAQLAVMDVSGESFANFTRRSLFQPLGLRHTTFEQPLPESLAPEAAWAYSDAPWFKGMPYVYPQQAAAGLYTTPAELARFLIELQNAARGQSSLFQRESALAMMTPQAVVSQGYYKEEIGVGPFLLQRADNTNADGRYFEFTGVNAGFLAYAIASVNGGNGAVIMINSGDNQNGLGKEIRRAIAQAYNWPGFLPDPIVPISLPRRQLAGFEGRYRRGPDEVVSIQREGGHLVRTVNGAEPILAFPVASDRFVFTDYNIEGVFSRNTAGRVTGFALGGQPVPMPRMSPEEFSPSELLAKGRLAEAKEAFRALRPDVSGLTYRVYEILRAKKPSLPAARTLLELGSELFPNEAIIHSRWGDYHLLKKEPAQALASYRRALELDPADEHAKERVRFIESAPGSSSRSRKQGR